MTVLLFSSIDDPPEPWRAALCRELPGLDFRVWPQAGALSDIDYALVWKAPAGMLKSLPRLKAILSLGAGVDHLFQDPDLPRNVPIVRMVDAGYAPQMSEYALYGVLHFHRNMDRYAEQQRRAEWRPLEALPSSQRVVGVLGLGVLGADFARKVVALGFDVLGWSRTPKQIAGVTALQGPEQFARFLSRTQILVNFLPLTPQTQGILRLETFAQLPRGAYLINIARGAHLVEADLLSALDSGQLAGAMLDVFEREPLRADHRFWCHPRIVATPHIAGQAIAELMVAQVVENIRRIERGEAPTGLVDAARGY